MIENNPSFHHSTLDCQLFKSLEGFEKLNIRHTLLKFLDILMKIPTFHPHCLQQMPRIMIKLWIVDNRVEHVLSIFA